MPPAMTADDRAYAGRFPDGPAARRGEAAARSAMRRSRGTAGKAAVRDFWAWLTGAAYRPERHYMRGGRAAAVGR